MAGGTFHTRIYFCKSSNEKQSNKEGNFAFANTKVLQIEEEDNNTRSSKAPILFHPNRTTLLSPGSSRQASLESNIKKKIVKKADPLKKLTQKDYNEQEAAKDTREATFEREHCSDKGFAITGSNYEKQNEQHL